MRSFCKIFLTVVGILILHHQTRAQLELSGTVYDSSHINFVPGVIVATKDGKFTTTDSLGRYTLSVNDKDSVTFTFGGKSTQKFSVHTVPDPAHFDISLRVNYRGKYHTLKEVVVFGKSYQEDSIENRETYAKVFNYQKPSFQTSISPGGVAGADVDEIINMFRFQRNKRLKTFQMRLEKDEQEKYVSYRFNKVLIKRITHLEGSQLDTFITRYRPSYEFVSTADELAFNQYILNCSYQFKAEQLKLGTSK
ncbi:MAG: hypothetical protein JST86_00100 [Bacteroidetes bacterium]|nr:hypothetical protein [Bacteroidota bacterium]